MRRDLSTLLAQLPPKLCFLREDFLLFFAQMITLRVRFARRFCQFLRAKTPQKGDLCANKGGFSVFLGPKSRIFLFYEEIQTQRFCGFQAKNPWFLSCATIKALSSREAGPKGVSSREDFGFCLYKRGARGPLSREGFDDLFAQKRKSENGLRFGCQPRSTTHQKREIFIFFASKLMERGAC